MNQDGTLLQNYRQRFLHRTWRITCYGDQVSMSDWIDRVFR